MHGGHQPADEDTYSRWVATHDRLDDGDRQRISQRIGDLAYRPRVSILLPLASEQVAAVEASVRSLRRQLYPRWELIPAPWQTGRPDERYGSFPSDPRLGDAEGPPAPDRVAALNRALERAGGDYAAILGPGDLLAEHALYLLVEALHSTDPPDLVYSDEDEIDVCGVRANPVFKPDWSPDLLHSVHYIGQLAVWRTELVRRLGGLRPEHGGAAEYDLALRARETLQPNRIAHIPWVLYHRRRDPASAGGTSAARGRSDAELGALRAHLEHRGPPARVREHAPGVRRVSFALPRQPPRVSVVIPTRDRVDLLRRCVAGLLGETDYPELELLLVDNASRESTTLGYLHEIGQDPRVRVLAEPGRFNYSRMNNRAARIARGSLLAFLNNDVEIVERGWLRELVGHALRPEVGAVGALLSYASGEIQHAGIILGPGGVASLRHRGRRDPARVSYDRRPFATRNLSAVTAACMVLRRSVFDEVGGFDETDLAVAFNDVDLCLRIGRRGYRIVWTPHSRLLHHESQSEGPHDRPERSREFQREVLVMQARWERQLRADPFYNPNLSLELGREYELASPPRRIRPWD